MEVEVQVFIDYLQLVRQLTVGRERRKEDYMQIKINDNLTENIKDISVSTGGGVFNLSELNTYLLNLLYPIGSMYLSVNSKSPATLFGGTWTQVGADYYLMTATLDATGTGGSLISGSTTLTAAQSGLPSHNHSFQGINDGAGFNSSIGSYPAKIYQDCVPNWTGYFINNAGGWNASEGHTHSITPPYFKVYAWYRTA